tara:strand:- start:2918 stop:3205 length:288 start_codon:yes stop_codon:yes gene_type:complete
MQIKKRDLYESPILERNVGKYGNSLGFDQCICCGRLMKESKSRKYVHMGTDWKAYNVSGTDGINIKGTEQQSQGAFYIGNSCAKKMKGFVFEPNK